MSVSEAESARRRARALVNTPPRQLVEVPSVLETIIKDEEHKADEKNAATVADLSKQTPPERKPEETGTAIISTPVDKSTSTPAIPSNTDFVKSVRPTKGSIDAEKSHQGYPIPYFKHDISDEHLKRPVRELKKEQEKQVGYPIPYFKRDVEVKEAISPVRSLLKKKEQEKQVGYPIPYFKRDGTEKKVDKPSRTLLKEDVDTAFMNVPFTSSINTRTINYAPIGFEEERFLTLKEPVKKAEGATTPSLQKSSEKIPQKSAVEVPKIDAVADNFFDVYPKATTKKAPTDSKKRVSKNLAQAKAKFEVDKLAGQVFDNNAKDADKKTESIVIQRDLFDTPFKKLMLKSEPKGFVASRFEFGTPEKKNVLI